MLPMKLGISAASTPIFSLTFTARQLSMLRYCTLHEKITLQARTGEGWGTQTVRGIITKLLKCNLLVRLDRKHYAITELGRATLAYVDAYQKVNNEKH